ncbi:MAG: pilus assembly protein [Rickettsiales bacterium]|jgi:Flp pilus assembly protein TadG|nr:pilus assembly protein [Rickettsiales bacterium]
MKIKTWRIFRRSQDGTTAIEFAMLSPVLILLMMGIVEFSMIMFTQAVMESATGSTARTGRTGYTETSGLTRQEQLIESVATRTAGLLDPNLITVSMTTYSAFNNVNRPEPYIDANGNGMYNAGETYTDINGNGQWDQDMGAAGAGEANDIVVYTVSYPWQIVTPVINRIIGTTYQLTARTVVKNEPW